MATEAQYEWLPPASGHGTYFTATQARMYIGNLFIDELNTVQFVYQGNQIPIYGYCSQDMDAIASGKRLVQGQILLNFISEGYLYTALNEFSRKMRVGTDTSQDAARIAALGAQRAELTNAASRGVSVIALEAIDAEIIAIASKNPDVIAEAGRLMSNTSTTSKNAIVLEIPFDVVIELTGGGRTATRKLEGCVLTSNETILDQSGVPVMDAYGFTARRLV